MTLYERLASLRVWLRLGVVCLIVGALFAVLVALQAPPRYTSQVSMLVGPPLSGPIDTNDIAVGQALRQTFADLADTRPLLERVIAATGVSISPTDLANAVSTRVPVDSSLLIVSVSWKDAGQAAMLANGVADQLVAYLTANAATGNTPPNVAISVVDPAIPATKSETMGVLTSAALGGGVGVVVALCIVFLVENLRPQLRRPGRTD